MVLLLYLFSNVELDFILFSWFHNIKQSPKIPNLNVKMFFEFLEFQNAMNVEIIDFKLMHLDLWAVGLLDKDLSDSNLDFLETDLDSFPVNIFWSARRLEDGLKTCLEDFLSTTISCLPGNLEDVWKTKNCYAEDIFKTSSRHVLKTSWRRLGD